MNAVIASASTNCPHQENHRCPTDQTMWLKRWVVSLALFGLSACGLNGPAQTTTQPQGDSSASVFSVWTEEPSAPSQSGLMQLDFKTLSISTSPQTIIVRQNSGETCRCSAIFSGATDRGSISVSNCQSSMGFVTIECSGFEGAKQYTVSNAKLNFCSTPRTGSVVRCSSFRE